MKLWTLGFLTLGLSACTADVFSADAGDDAEEADAGHVVMPPRLALRPVAEDDAGADASDGGNACSPLSPKEVSECSGNAALCATADGGLTCGNGSNAPCVSEQGFFAECWGPHDCIASSTGSLCVLLGNPTLTDSCPAVSGGATASCASTGVFSIQPSARVVCQKDSDCTMVADAGTKCVARAVEGFPALAGEVLGVCE